MTWQDFLNTYTPSPSHRHDALGLDICRLAWQAASEGTYGVGAVIVSPEGEVVARGYNQVRIRGYRSDLHAEMVVLNDFESFEMLSTIGDYTLITSLEPCPMCTARMLLAGIRNVRYLAPDKIGGMTAHFDALPPFFKDLALREDQDWLPADCTEELRCAAHDIWEESHNRIHA